MREKNRNAVHARRALEDLGATILAVENGGKHTIIKFATPAGVHEQMHVSKGGVIDPYKTRGWARQILHRADGRVDHKAQKNRR